MDVIRHSDVRGFAERVMPMLRSDPARHTIAITVLTGLVESVPDDTVMLTVERGGQLIGCGFRVPARSFLVSALPGETHQAVVDFLVREGIALNGVSGPRDVADAMVPLWTRATGQVPNFTMGLRLHRLEDFTQIGAPGRFRHAEDADVPLLGQWWDAFEAEDFGTARGDGEVQVRHEISHGVRRFGFWTDGGEEPVAMAGGSPPLHGMSRIGPVYTPKEFRGRGYGTAVTAAMTRWALDEGARDVLLFTDIANPISNAIYHRIGYRPVMEAVEHRMPDANTLDV